MGGLDDALLIERARGADVAAFGFLVRRYQEVAFRVAFLILGDAHEAEDVVQDALLNAYRALHRFEPGAPFRPWLLEIVANQARNRRRAAGRRAHLALRAAAVLDERTAPSPEATVVQAEQHRHLLAALESLRDDDRQAIAMRYFLELSEADMAAALGCARGTVKSRLSRALARLRSRLSEAVHA